MVYDLGWPADAKIPFSIEVNMLPGDKAQYKLFFRNLCQPLFALEENCIVGFIGLSSDFPMHYEVHPSLSLTQGQLHWFEEFVRNRVKESFPGITKILELTAVGAPTIEFVPTNGNDLWLMCGIGHPQGGLR